MNKLHLLALVAIFAVACNQDAPESKEVLLTGQIANAKGDSIAFSVNDDYLKFPVDENGNFDARFTADAGYYTFNYQRERATCYLTPGDSSHVSFDTAEFDESMTFSGASANDNNYLAGKYLLKEDLGKERDIRTLYSMPEDSFLMAIDASRETVEAFLAQADISETFRTIEEQNLKYEFVRDKMNYESYHKYFAGVEEVALSESLQAMIDGIDYSDEQKFKTVPSYKAMVEGHFMDIAYMEGIEDALTEMGEFESAYLKEKLATNMLMILGPGEQNLNAVVDKLKTFVSDEDLVADLDEKYESLKMLIPGNASPSFEFKNVNDQMVSIEDLKGKNLYIDVWATWCGPCKAEIPHLKKLESEYQDKNIEFVSISVDVPADEQKWKDMVAEKELKGIQLMSDNGWDTDFVKDYLIRGIPRFILIDKEGKIISADAPRPSSNDKIKEMINNLLVSA
ncbi:MAG: TlpA family protein disulfide reductase [Saprospiraceae bacterium]|jgi:thiol-disulfide isomerase/thioredoxin